MPEESETGGMNAGDYIDILSDLSKVSEEERDEGWKQRVQACLRLINSTG